MSGSLFVGVDWDRDGGLTLGEFETDLGYWRGGGTFPGTEVSRSTVRAYSGAASMLIGWRTGTSGPQAQLALPPSYEYIVGRTYVYTAWVWVPTGSPKAQLAVVNTVSFSGASGNRDSWQPISVVFTAASTNRFTDLQVWPVGTAVDGNQVWVDHIQIAVVGEDVTDRIRGGVTVEYGRDQTTALAPTVAGRGGFNLDNQSRAYSPRNTASPLYGKIKPARPVLMQRTVTLGGTPTIYTLFAGHTDDSPINPDVDSKTVGLSLVDHLADFRGRALSTPLYRGIRTGEAVGAVLDAAGWTGGRVLDLGVTVIPWWWEEGTDALTALEKILRSEGPPALLTVGTSGEIVFKDRHHRLTDAASLTSQATWRGTPGAAEPVMGRPFGYDEAWRNIVNYASVAVDVRAPTDLTVVWTSEATIDLTDGETKLITATSVDPFYGAVTPDASDIRLAFGVVTAALTRDSGAATTILLTASGGPAQVVGLQLRAVPVPVAYSTQLSASDSDSITDYGARSLPDSIPWVGLGDARAIVDTVVAQRAQPLPVVTVRFPLGRNATRAAAVLARDLSDRVTIVEPETAVNGAFFIESIAHTFTGEDDHAVIIGLEAAPTAQTGVFRFNGAVGERFDEGVFGDGQDNPANMFRFDGTSGHRFDEGVFAT